MTENEAGTIIVDSAVAIHRGTGPGLLESVYEAILASELRNRGLRVQRQVPVSIRYNGAHEGGRLSFRERALTGRVFAQRRRGAETKRRI